MIGRVGTGHLPASAGWLAALLVAVAGAGVSAETAETPSFSPGTASEARPDAVSRGDSPSAAADTAGSPVVLRRGWPVMGTLLELTAVAPDSGRARAALAAGRGEVVRLDSLLSTYRPESEVSRLNAAAGTGAWTELSPATARALRKALRWAERTGGAVDPTVGPLVDAWGFRGRKPSVPDGARLDSARRLVGWEQVETREGGRLARLPEEGMRLDFGAVGKGMALERAVDAMREAGAAGGMVDLGGQVSVFGRPPPMDSDSASTGEGGGGGWRLGIRHPRTDDHLLGTLSLDSGSVATSGDAEQFFRRDGVRYSHIMDARSGRPARGVAQVTVVAADGSTADALATALFVMGPDRGREWLRRNDRIGPGQARLPLVLWVRDPGEGPVWLEHVVRFALDADHVALALRHFCVDEVSR